MIAARSQEDRHVVPQMTSGWPAPRGIVTADACAHVLATAPKHPGMPNPHPSSTLSESASGLRAVAELLYTMSTWPSMVSVANLELGLGREV